MPVFCSVLCDILPLTLTRSNSLKFGGNWKFIKAAQWNTQSTPWNALPITSSVGSQMSPMKDVTFFVSAWPVKLQDSNELAALLSLLLLSSAIDFRRCVGGGEKKQRERKKRGKHQSIYNEILINFFTWRLKFSRTIGGGSTKQISATHCPYYKYV